MVHALIEKKAKRDTTYSEASKLALLNEWQQFVSSADNSELKQAILRREHAVKQFNSPELLRQCEQGGKTKQGGVDVLREVATEMLRIAQKEMSTRSRE